MSAATARPAACRYRIKGSRVYVDTAGLSGVTAPAPDPAYRAASTAGTRGRAWRASGVGPNAALDFSGQTLVNRSRDAVRQNPLADSAKATLETNIVGRGIKPQWKTPDAGLNRALGELWSDWVEEADADGRLGFYGQQALASGSMIEGGEVFARLRVRRPGDVDTVPLQIQLLESEFCPRDEFRFEGNQEVRNGVVFDRVGRRVAYLMYRNHPYDTSAFASTFDPLPRPVPGSEVAHMARLRRPGEIRGEPWLTRALIKLRDIDRFDDATLVRQQAQSLIAAFITTSEDSEFSGEGEADEHGVATVSWEPATMQKLLPGEDVTFSDPSEVGGTYEPFMREQKRSVAMAAGVMYEQLTGDYSQVNDRTFRASVNEFRRRVEMWQHHILAQQLCRAVGRRWLDLGLMAGLITLPRSVELRDLRKIVWVPQGWHYIHPVQEVQADALAVRNGFKARAHVVSERGMEVGEVDRLQAEDYGRADDLGLAYDSDGRRKASSGGRTAASDDEERERQDA